MCPVLAASSFGCVRFQLRSASVASGFDCVRLRLCPVSVVSCFGCAWLRLCPVSGVLGFGFWGCGRAEWVWSPFVRRRAGGGEWKKWRGWLKRVEEAIEWAKARGGRWRKIAEAGDVNADMSGGEFGGGPVKRGVRTADGDHAKAGREVFERCAGAGLWRAGGGWGTFVGGGGGMGVLGGKCRGEIDAVFVSGARAEAAVNALGLG